MITAFHSIERLCPRCGEDSFQTLMSLEVRDFLSVNDGYDGTTLADLLTIENDVFPIVECKRCRFVYSRFRLNNEATHFLYAELIDHDHSLAKIANRRKRMHLLAVWQTLFELSTQHRERFELKVFDYGCGWGDFLSVAQSHGVKCYGLEVDQEKLAWATRMGLEVFDDESQIDALSPFDILFCDQVLEHVDAPMETMRRLSDWLKPKGVAFISVPDAGGSRIRQTCENHKRGRPISKGFNPWEHLNYFSRHALESMLAAVALTRISPESVSTGRLGRLLSRLMPRGARKELGLYVYCRKTVSARAYHSNTSRPTGAHENVV